jgi:hypothetical protein
MMVGTFKKLDHLEDLVLGGRIIQDASRETDVLLRNMFLKKSVFRDASCIKVDHKEIGFYDLDWINVIQDR